ncbi:bacterioferritin-associated ferredoxin [Suttonella ornithocola]|uniref:Bacterioferritin-associated ferredoxin n=1 Tax=Suttonella ornithocola TaxID=279832 RepID=A0A380MPD2_9GAMM|nr:bacterioferritin-associated ferredoxin [Suttonella ornithocola]SUO93147.1 Bacterioferritin-associated ferredoxin [Suttonella ornithocola]
MYICLCYGITDKQIQYAIENGATTRSALAKELGVGTQCGCCRRHVSEILSEHLEKNMATEDIPAAIGVYFPASA